MNPTTRILTWFLIVPIILIQATTATAKTPEVISASTHLENVYVQYMQKLLNQAIDLKQEFPNLTMDDMNKITAAS